jgi:hypothetical protein
MGYGPWVLGRTLLLLAVAASGEAAELGWTEVAVRVYHSGVVTEADETRALGVAAGILAAADVTPRWIHCHAAARPDAACTRPLGPGELSLRVTRTGRPMGRAQAVALGDALLGAGNAAPALATVYLERVDDLARRSHADAPILLGRAIAHELTHLLTGTGRHATTGLMRPVWRAAELARERAPDWTLDAASVTAVRARAAAAMTLAQR